MKYTTFLLYLNHSKSIALILILLGNYFISFAQENSNRIEWTAENQIDWNDFTGNPDYSDYRIAAITSSLIQYRYYCENSMLIFDSKAIFIRNESWVKPENKNEKTLNHERLHFDITEYFNRILKQRVATQTWKCDEVDALEKLVNTTLNEWREAQLRYDRDTWYSLNSSMQKEWQNLVKERLNDE